MGMGVLGGCGVATAIVFALIGVLGNHNGTVPQAAATGPEDERQSQPVVRQTKSSQPSEKTLQTPAADGPVMTELWSGDYKLRMGTNYELDKGNEPVQSKGSTNEIWVDNLGDAGYVVFTEAALAPWDIIGRNPTPQQCLRTLQSSATTQIDITIGDAGRGICVRSSDGDRYAYFSLTTVNRTAISGTLTLWSTDTQQP